ncbi:MAG: FxLYD domain-containing protein [Thermoproteota archaeon]
MLRLSSLALVAISGILSALLGIAYAQSNGDGVEVIKSSLVFDSNANIHVLGEVVNNGDRSVGTVFVIAIFYDDNRSLASNHAYIQATSLRPGEKSGFDIVFEEIQYNEEGLEFDKYELVVNSQSTGPKSACLSLNVTRGFLDDTGNYQLEGTVTNNGNQLTESIKVSATFYNTTGHVIAIDSVNVVNDDDEEFLLPNESAEFDLIGAPYDSNSNISSYSINVESMQYSMINPVITKDNIACPIRPSTSITLHINSTTSTSPLTYDLVASGKVAVPIEGERYVVLEIYNQDQQLYHRDICELAEDNSYLCTTTFYPLDEHDFVLRAKYVGAFAESTFAVLNTEVNEPEDVDGSSTSIGSVVANSSLVLDDGSIVADNSTISDVSKITLSTNLRNNNPTLQSVAMIMQVRDSNNTTVFLDYNSIVLAPGEDMLLINEWTPDVYGEVTIELFIWDRIGNNSNPLSEVHRKHMVLAAA